MRPNVTERQDITTGDLLVGIGFVHRVSFPYLDLGPGRGSARVDGTFIKLNNEKLVVRSVTYGASAPN